MKKEVACENDEGELSITINASKSKKDRIDMMLRKMRISPNFHAKHVSFSNSATAGRV